MRDAETILSIIRERGRQGLPLENVYRQLYNPNLYLRAYGKIYPNKGAMTPGITEATVDGMSLSKIDQLIAEIRYERYQWTPVRRVYIPKPNGKERPLGIPTWKDKLLQEVIRSILEAYYEPQFSDYSHGFRPGRGCHTALWEIRHTWTGTRWFIEGDLVQCFDTLDHEVLLEILAEKLHDNRSIQLIRNLLRGGYLENWKYHATYSGAPQGGIVSPILSNIYLNKLDQYIEQTLIPENTRGENRRINPLYKQITRKMSRAQKGGRKEEYRQLQKQQQRTPSKLQNDPDFRRLHYCRYADDILLGFIGPRQEAETIKAQLGEFLKGTLKLKLSEEKALLTHANTQAARFLGYHIVTQQGDVKQTGGGRSINGRIALRIPQEVVDHKCARYMTQGKPTHLAARLTDRDFSIVAQYQSEYRGMVQYYILAQNLSCLNKVHWVMKTSLLKTLAAKHKTSTGKILCQYATTIRTSSGQELKGLEVRVEGEGKDPLIARFGGISLQHKTRATIQDELPPPTNTRTEIEQRLLANQCELCGSTERIQVHHIRKLADLQRKGRPKPEWAKIMSARHRKTLVVCQNCHTDIHAGRPIRHVSK